MLTEIAYTPECTEQIIHAPAFTYLMDQNGIIYYSTGDHTHPSANAIRTTAVYFPDPEGDRISMLTGQAYTKHIVHGYVTQDQVASVPDSRRNLHLLTFASDPVTQEKILAVDTETVDTLFDPHGALNDVLGSTSQYAEIVRRRVATVIEAMTRAGIPYEDLGLYGSLQVGLVPEDPSQLLGFNDVDLVVQGTHHYHQVVELAAIYHNGGNARKRTVVRHAHNLAARRRRQQLSKLHLYDHEGAFFSDVKVVPGPYEVPSVTDLGFLGDTFDLISSSVVIEAHESLGYPAIWTVNGPSGPIKVYSRMYDNIGAAGVGDQVCVRGQLNDRGDTIVLTENKSHHIYPTEII